MYTALTFNMFLLPKPDCIQRGEIIHKYTGFSLSLCVMLMDGTVITLAGVTLSPERALHALIGLFVTGKVIDAVEMGLSNSKVAYIISNQKETIMQAISGRSAGNPRLTGRGFLLWIAGEALRSLSVKRIGRSTYLNLRV